VSDQKGVALLGPQVERNLRLATLEAQQLEAQVL
jgi:hypothetical protein